MRRKDKRSNHDGAGDPLTGLEADVPFLGDKPMTGMLASPVMVFWNIEKR